MIENTVSSKLTVVVLAESGRKSNDKYRIPAHIPLGTNHGLRTRGPLTCCQVTGWSIQHGCAPLLDSQWSLLLQVSSQVTIVNVQ